MILHSERGPLTGRRTSSAVGVTTAASERKLALWNIGFAYTAFLIGTLCGLIQVFMRNEMIQLPAWLDYYQVLTVHGVTLALVYTTFFIYAFLITGMSKALGSFGPKVARWSWIGFFVAAAGTVWATIEILSGRASVLYTFYAPLKASGWFYVSLALLIIGTWIISFALIAHYVKWRKANPGVMSPLFAFMTISTLTMWIIACLGIVVAVVFMYIPWAFGWVETINVELSRTLFWFFGHPLVYFWLLPAYMAWYLVVPKLLGTKVFSDSLARLSFLLFILFSIPVGLHHQLTEPGVADFWKFLQVSLTFMVVIPTLMTAFSLFATFEISGRQKGAKGLFGWFTKLPWNDIRFTSLFIAMVFFIPGGAGGIINTSFQLNELVHNTLWVVGHFHITVGTPVAMTFMGISFWLIPYLTGRTLSKTTKKLAFVQIISWSVGMLFMSTAQHVLGLLGAPRRTQHSNYSDHPTVMGWFDGFFSNTATLALGGIILFFSAMLLMVIVFRLWLIEPRSEEGDLYAEFPVAESDASATPRWLENWWIWIGIAVALILLAYTFPITHMIQDAPPGSKGFINW